MILIVVGGTESVTTNRERRRPVVVVLIRVICRPALNLLLFFLFLLYFTHDDTSHILGRNEKLHLSAGAKLMSIRCIWNSFVQIPAIKREALKHCLIG